MATTQIDIKGVWDTTTGQLTGLVGPSAPEMPFSSLVSGAGTATSAPLTTSGTYTATGSGATLAVTTGWRPTLVVLKSDKATTAAMWKGNGATNWHDRTDFFGAQDSENAISFTDTGFSVTGLANTNTNSDVYHWFAYCDNGSGDLIQTSYHGNGLDGRVLRLSERPLQFGFVKRDGNYIGAFSQIEVGGCLVTGQAGRYDLAADGLSISTDNLTSTNHWAGLYGEGHAFLGVPMESASIATYSYTGTGVARKMPFPWPVEAFAIIPRDTTTGTTSMRWWFASMTGVQMVSISAAAILAAELTAVDDEGVTLSTSNGVNQLNKRYVLVAFRKRRAGAVVESFPALKSQAFVRLAAGYIRCGTDASLAVAQGAPMSLEWFGSVDGLSPTATSDFPDDNTIDNVANAQFPLVFRSAGADRTDGAVNYGMELADAAAYDPWRVTQPEKAWHGQTLLIAGRSHWRLKYTGSGDPDLQTLPLNTGIVYQRGPVHYLMTYDGSGQWVLYVNGRARKFRDLPYAAPALAPAAGHEFVIGARLRGGATPDHAITGSVRTVRLYKRVLTAAEALQNYRSHFVGYPDAVSDFAEELLASNSMRATRNPANNGVITNGVVTGAR